MFLALYSPSLVSTQKKVTIHVPSPSPSLVSTQKKVTIHVPSPSPSLVSTQKKVTIHVPSNRDRSVGFNGRSQYALALVCVS